MTVLASAKGTSKADREDCGARDQEISRTCKVTQQSRCGRIIPDTLGDDEPSFFTGWLIKRFGDLNIITVGAIISALSIAVNLSGDSLIHLRFAMALVGVGWNFMFTGGTTLLLQTYTPAEKAKTQGINDFFVFGTVAVCSLLAGATYQTVGWAAVNLAAVPLLVLVIAANIWLRGRKVPMAA